MFQTACGRADKGGWGLAPSEFWAMSPVEWWQLYDFNVGYALADKIKTDNRLLNLLKQGLKENEERKKCNR